MEKQLIIKIRQLYIEIEELNKIRWNSNKDFENNKIIEKKKKQYKTYCLLLKQMRNKK